MTELELIEAYEALRTKATFLELEVRRLERVIGGGVTPISYTPIVRLARALAEIYHGKQKYGALDYVAHLDDVAKHVKDWGSDALVLAYLHDTLEDTDLLPDLVAELFGQKTLDCLYILTDEDGQNRKERKAKTYAKLSKIDAGSEVSLALVVKAADRLANVSACVRTEHKGLLDMYRGEQSAFREAVFREGLTEGLMAEIDRLFEDNPPQT